MLPSLLTIVSCSHPSARQFAVLLRYNVQLDYFLVQYGARETAPTAIRHANDWALRCRLLAVVVHYKYGLSFIVHHQYVADLIAKNVKLFSQSFLKSFNNHWNIFLNFKSNWSFLEWKLTCFVKVILIFGYAGGFAFFNRTNSTVIFLIFFTFGLAMTPLVRILEESWINLLQAMLIGMFLTSTRQAINLGMIFFVIGTVAQVNKFYLLFILFSRSFSRSHFWFKFCTSKK